MRRPNFPTTYASETITKAAAQANIARQSHLLRNEAAELAQQVGGGGHQRLVAGAAGERLVRALRSISLRAHDNEKKWEKA